MVHKDAPALVAEARNLLPPHTERGPSHKLLLCPPPQPRRPLLRLSGRAPHSAERLYNVLCMEPQRPAAAQSGGKAGEGKLSSAGVESLSGAGGYEGQPIQQPLQGHIQEVGHAMLQLLHSPRQHIPAIIFSVAVLALAPLTLDEAQQARVRVFYLRGALQCLYATQFHQPYRHAHGLMLKSRVGDILQQPSDERGPGEAVLYSGTRIPSLARPRVQTHPGAPALHLV